MECSICNEFYNHSNKQPRVFDCGHTFCLNCCQGLQMICPLDRKKTQNMNKNYALEQILIGKDHNKLHEPQQINKQSQQHTAESTPIVPNPPVNPPVNPVINNPKPIVRQELKNTLKTLAIIIVFTYVYLGLKLLKANNKINQLEMKVSILDVNNIYSLEKFQKQASIFDVFYIFKSDENQGIINETLNHTNQNVLPQERLIKYQNQLMSDKVIDAILIVLQMIFWIFLALMGLSLICMVLYGLFYCTACCLCCCCCWFAALLEKKKQN